MENNNNAPKVYEKEHDLWAAYSTKTFVKMKDEWFCNSDITPGSGGDPFNSRILLSFVDREAQERNKNRGNGNQEPAYIDIGIPMVSAGSDGNGNSGVTALSLASLIESGSLHRKAKMARDAAKQQGKQFADPVWQCIGGAKGQAVYTNGKPSYPNAKFRRLTIGPAQKENRFLMTASMCDGKVDPVKGGITPKEGAKWFNIRVPVDGEYMLTFAKQVNAMWNAHMATCAVSKNVNALISAAVAKEISALMASLPAMIAEAVGSAGAAPASAPAKVIKPKEVFFVYDGLFHDETFPTMGCAFSAKGAVMVIKNNIAYLSNNHPSKFVCKDEKDLDALYTAILNDTSTGNYAFPSVTLVSSNGSTNSDGELDTAVLAVTVVRECLRPKQAGAGKNGKG